MHATLLKNAKRNSRLTKLEKKALEEYTGSNYFKMNQVLRKLIEPTANETGLIKNTRTALAKPNLKLVQGSVFRGSNKLPEDVKKGLIEGATFQDAGFLSTSKDEDQSFLTQDSGFFFRIQSKTGRFVAPYSRHKKEQEVLFQPNTMFRITSVKEGAQMSGFNDVTIVEMEEIW